MTRASFECPVTGEQCSAPNCKKTFCKLKGRIAMEEEEHRRQYIGKLLRSGKSDELLYELGLAPKRPRIKRRF